ncbi:MAG TPA: SDR family oxidoreductase, partial [Blastocatellia bacterium]|nr:SDR family oxidoreductase [Blastocatellia bacterium]
QGAESVANEIGGLAVRTDVALDSDLAHLVYTAMTTFGQIDLFCSNAGIAIDGGPEVPDNDWLRIMDVNVMAHVYAARAVLPGMLARGDGYLLQTVSAAGLLTQIGSAPYSVTKHAALAFAEWLAITYGDRGIKVSALCPQGVLTNMLLSSTEEAGAFLKEGALAPERVADIVVDALKEEQFLILPHPEVAEYFRRKASDYDRWLRGMRRLQATIQADAASG